MIYLTHSKTYSKYTNSNQATTCHFPEGGHLIGLRMYLELRVPVASRMPDCRPYDSVRQAWTEEARRLTLNTEIYAFT